MRDLTITLEPVAGMCNRFYAFVVTNNGIKRWIAADGNQRRTKKGKVSDERVRIQTRVWGIGAAKYKLTIDLPGTASDQAIEFTLNSGYHETEITI